MDRSALNVITGKIVDAAMRVHTKLGPGLLESAYEAAMICELGRRALRVAAQQEMPVKYDDIRINLGYRIDLLVEGEVIVELKAVEQVHDVHKAQLLSYLRLSGLPVGLLLNFNVKQMKDGIIRYVN